MTIHVVPMVSHAEAPVPKGGLLALLQRAVARRASAQPRTEPRAPEGNILGIVGR